MLKQLKAKIKKFNKPLPLLDYFMSLIGDKKEVKILDLGCGPFATIGQFLNGIRVEIHRADHVDFSKFWEQYKTVPLFKTEIQNMEKLTYEDEFFDIVNCVNALDHTIDALSAVREMIRVCKTGGWVYIDCALIQKTAQRKRHYWDALENGNLVNERNKFCLKNLGFKVELINNHGERQYNHIIAKLKK